MLRTLLVAFTIGPGLVLTSPSSAQGERPPIPSRILPSVKMLPTIEVASLGMTTTASLREEAEARGLKIEVCVRGQLVTRVKRNGPAAKAGIGVGDVLEKLDDNEIYSQDDIADFLAASNPKQMVKLQLVLAKGKKRKQLQVVLGTKRVKAPKKPRLEWQFASLGQLDEAVAKAKIEKRLILVGLSGAET